MNPRPEDTLMVEVGKNLMAELTKLGHQAVDEVTRQVNQKGLPVDSLPGIWWMLVTGSDLPQLKRSPDFSLLLDILHSTGTLPKYRFGRLFEVDNWQVVAAFLPEIADYMVAWASKDMRKGLLVAYQKALRSQEKEVQQATEGRVPRGKEVAFLRRAFPQVLTLRSRWFADGEFLRRVVRSLPV